MANHTVQSTIRSFLELYTVKFQDMCQARLANHERWQGTHGDVDRRRAAQRVAVASKATSGFVHASDARAPIMASKNRRCTVLRVPAAGGRRWQRRRREGALATKGVLTTRGALGKKGAHATKGALATKRFDEIHATAGS